MFINDSFAKEYIIETKKFKKISKSTDINYSISMFINESFDKEYIIETKKLKKISKSTDIIQ
jgi:hypothetical protein